ncbi:helix-turn-helix domain-containing protein [Rhizobium cremeum]|uniref:Crp/Fnr family transcriptional regulator n=1 Tax=Rhizobium cremeum TaxID=2813827 RepID=UPI000DD931D5|nr:helix-turn-helix domain-containing protein [Rhizobium cremeum]MCJ7995674.1 helix-turn-helix domain-containing protein [Rhizobium cremeum]MCJ8001172.1 helix-turn-helix domain-containing protein [Rhizobium cremeum]
MLDLPAASLVARGLPPEFQAQPPIARPPFSPRRLIAPGALIYTEGAERSPILRLKDGCVVLTQSLDGKRRQILDVIGPGRLFGLAHGKTNHCSAEACTYSEIEAVDPQRERLNVEDALLHSLKRAQKHATLLGRKTTMEKIAAAIADLALQFGRPGFVGSRRAETFHLYLTRSDLGDWLGLTIETVSRYLNQLKRGGIIDFSDPQIVSILDADKLAALAGGGAVDGTLCIA